MKALRLIAVTFALGVGLMAEAPQTARAQSCPGSELIYIVRDEKGAAIDVPRTDLRYQSIVKWKSATGFVSAQMRVPKTITALGEKLSALAISGMCSFREEPTLKLTLNGKSMNLTFHTHPLPGYGSTNYLIDSLPFQQGTFEIDVPNNADFAPQFYAASGWKKVSENADLVPEPSYSFVHGQVIDAITKTPIAGARVSLLSWLATEMGKKGSVTTDGAGRFQIDGLRDDYMTRGWDVAVVAEHPDYSNIYMLFYPVPGQGAARADPKTRPPFKSIERATIELMPLATVSGRLIDAATGGVPGDLDRLTLTFTYRKSTYLPGGNIEYPTGEVTTKLNADGTFSMRTGIGKNVVSSVEGLYSGSCGKCYYLATDDDQTGEVDVPKEGRSGLILKLKSKPR